MVKEQGERGRLLTLGGKDRLCPVPRAVALCPTVLPAPLARAAGKCPRSGCGCRRRLDVRGGKRVRERPRAERGGDVHVGTGPFLPGERQGTSHPTGRTPAGTVQVGKLLTWAPCGSPRPQPASAVGAGGCSSTGAALDPTSRESVASEGWQEGKPYS